MAAELRLFVVPCTLAVLLAGRLKKARVAGDAVIVNILSVRHVGHLSIPTDAEGAFRTLLDELHFDLMILQLRLTEATTKQPRWNIDVRLAKSHRYSVVMAVNDTGLGHGIAYKERAP